MLALRRPGLALLLAAGSPAVSPLRTFDYRGYAELLQIRSHSENRPIPMSACQHNTKLALEYVLAAAAVANVVLNSWQLSNRTIYAGGAQTWGLPLLWALLTIPAHLFGAIAVYLRVDLQSVDGATRSGAESQLFSHVSVSKHTREEFRLSASQKPMVMALRKESYIFLFASWLTSTFVIVHIMFGTLVLGSSLFISPPDAARVVGQYLVSTLVCRAIVSFEMRGIRQTVISRKPTSQLEDEPRQSRGIQARSTL